VGMEGEEIYKSGSVCVARKRCLEDSDISCVTCRADG
jgi:hypothetical protein